MAFCIWLYFGSVDFEPHFFWNLDAESMNIWSLDNRFVGKSSQDRKGFKKSTTWHSDLSALGKSAQDTSFVRVEKEVLCEQHAENKNG